MECMIYYAFSVPHTSSVKITLTPELDETLKRIQDSKNVAGIMLINKEGITVKSSLDSSVTAQVSTFLLYILYATNSCPYYKRYTMKTSGRNKLNKFVEVS